MDDELADCGAIASPPQWGLISPSGLMAALQIVTIVFTQVKQNSLLGMISSGNVGEQNIETDHVLCTLNADIE